MLRTQRARPILEHVRVLPLGQLQAGIQRHELDPLAFSRPVNVARKLKSFAETLDHAVYRFTEDSEFIVVADAAPACEVALRDRLARCADLL